ncbi:MAG: hypothetical protein ACKVW3_15415 [Phycisphaerales bacterium]
MLGEQKGNASLRTRLFDPPLLRARGQDLATGNNQAERWIAVAQKKPRR